MLGMVTRGDSFFLFCFFDALGMSAFGWALHTHTLAQFQGPGALFLDSSLFSEEKKVKRVSRG